MVFKERGRSYDPHSAVAWTLTMMSLGCCTASQSVFLRYEYWGTDYLRFGTGRSSTATFLGPWKTTAFIVSGRAIFSLVMMRENGINVKGVDEMDVRHNIVLRRRWNTMKADAGGVVPYSRG